MPKLTCKQFVANLAPNRPWEKVHGYILFFALRSIIALTGVELVVQDDAWLIQVDNSRRSDYFYGAVLKFWRDILSRLGSRPPQNIHPLASLAFPFTSHLQPFSGLSTSYLRTPEPTRCASICPLCTRPLLFFPPLSTAFVFAFCLRVFLRTSFFAPFFSGLLLPLSFLLLLVLTFPSSSSLLWVVSRRRS